MNTAHNDKSVYPLQEYQRRMALIAGFSLLAMTIAILLAQGLALNGIIVTGDGAAIVNNILTNEGRYRMAIVGHLVVVILDLVVAWAFYEFLKPTKSQLSLLAAWFRVVYTLIFGMAVVNMISALRLVGAGASLSTSQTPLIQFQVTNLLDAFTDTWNVGYIFFGLHLTLLGIVAFRSGFIPKIIAILLGLGGLSYLVDYSGLILFPNFNLETSLVFGWGELIFMVWLLIRGGKTQFPAGIPENPSSTKQETDR